MQPKLTSVEEALGSALPHRRMEAWKWTDVRGEVAVQQSGLTSACAPDIKLPSGMTMHRETRPASDSAMGALAANFAGDAYIIDVPAGLSPDTPFEITGFDSGHVRIFIKLAKGATLKTVERYESAAASFSNVELHFDLSENASLIRSLFHNDNENSTRIVTSYINAWSGAKISQHTLSFGAGLSRLETRIASLDVNLQAQIHGAYLLGGKRHCDMTSYMDLGAKSANIRQSVKGVATDKACGVFQGKFHVRRPAQLTDAQMRHDAIMLSDSCHIKAKPELEIYADDVACAHGNTVGALDDSALFYMRQRGIPIRQARALLTQVFVAQSFDTMEDSSNFLSETTDWLEKKS